MISEESLVHINEESDKVYEKIVFAMKDHINPWMKDGKSFGELTCLLIAITAKFYSAILLAIENSAMTDQEKSYAERVRSIIDKMTDEYIINEKTISITRTTKKKSTLQ